jgi:hypothetical protein
MASSLFSNRYPQGSKGIQLLGFAERRPDAVRVLHPFDVAILQQNGSHYDPTSSNTQGRVTAVFRDNVSMPPEFSTSRTLPKGMPWRKLR